MLHLFWEWTFLYPMFDFSPPTYSVTLGDLDQSTQNESVSIVITASAIIHPNFEMNESYIDNDIALLKLSQPVNFTAYPHIRPICVSQYAIPSTGQTVVDAG